MPRVDLYPHTDRLEVLNSSLSLSEKLRFMHDLIREKHEFVTRIALAMYDDRNDTIKTLADSGDGDSPLVRYAVPIAKAASLEEIMQRRKPRVVNDLMVFAGGDKAHTKAIGKRAFGASYTVPIIYGDEFYGFVFINADRKDVFTENALAELDLHCRLLILLIVTEVSNIRTLSATIRSALQITHERDPETGSHLDRMSAYSRLIAVELADRYDLDDVFIEHLVLFAPLHDLGKISIPDSILLKPGRLSDAEYEVMKTHALRGREMIDHLLANYRLEQLAEISILRNIAEYHHEAVDGSGYPHGLAGEDIPIESRIVTVADIFDALTSVRPYKEAWDNERAFDLLREFAGVKVDQGCVDALVGNIDQVLAIQRSIREEQYG